MELLLRFYKFADWRVVEFGGERCILLPMDRNGIDLSEQGNLPFMRMLVSTPGKMNNKDGFIRILTPTIPRPLRDKLMAQGWKEYGEFDLCGDDDGKIHTPVVAGLRPLLWAASFNDDLGSTYDKLFGLKLKKVKDDD